MDEAIALRRLAWRCRRGMRELDVLLERFLREQYAAAPAGERAAFEALLELPDPLIARYLLGGGTPPDPAGQALIQRLSRRGSSAGHSADTKG